MAWGTLVLLLLSAVCQAEQQNITTATNTNRSFTIDTENDRFLLDGTPFRFVSGSLHYFRVPHQLWRDRLRKLRAAGLNAVATYVEWSLHEPKPDHHIFTGDADLLHFIHLAEAEGLLVILRVGPYICAERDMGGFPPWLLTRNPEMRLRTSDPSYLNYVDRWLSFLLPLITPVLYGKGGPVIMVQVENEYGSYPSCDFDYTRWLRDKFKQYVGNDALLFTTDGSSDYLLRCGKIEDVYATVDFSVGTNVTAAFNAMRNHQPHGPYVNTEFYPGWLSRWGEPYQRVQTQSIVSTLDQILSVNASVNFYVFFGGTNYGFTSGANFNNQYQPQLTSYDYDAPINEAGDPTSKYFAIREVIGKYLPLPDIPLPVAKEKGNYGPVAMYPLAALLSDSVRQKLGTETVNSDFPLTFEQIGQSYGFVLYETIIPSGFSDPALLDIPGIKDRAIVLIDRVFVSILSRTQGITAVPLLLRSGCKLQILVENQGRINFGNKINDFKGITSNVTLSGILLTDWNITGFPLSDIYPLQQMETLALTSPEPFFYRGFFSVSGNDTVPRDTYLDVSGWYKGVAFVNGHNLGRYWPIEGPQVTLYIPGVFLHPSPALNEVVLLELESVSPDRVVILTAESILDKKPPVRGRQTPCQ